MIITLHIAQLVGRLNKTVCAFYWMPGCLQKKVSVEEVLDHRHGEGDHADGDGDVDGDGVADADADAEADE